MASHIVHESLRGLFLLPLLQRVTRIIIQSETPQLAHAMDRELKELWLVACGCVSIGCSKFQGRAEDCVLDQCQLL